MIEFNIEIAGLVAKICAQFKTTRRYCRGYRTDKEAAFCVESTPEDLAYERERQQREWKLEGLSQEDFSDEILELTAVQRKLAEHLFERDVLVFHGSVVAVDGQAYLFTATSGTGKSTHTRFWRETFGDRAVMVNDDKPFLRITEDAVLVYGSPWNGKHRLGNNICVPLKGICILERGDENVINPISGEEAMMMLFQQSNRPLELRKMPIYMDLIDKLSKQTSFYRMQCNLDPDAARVAYETMSK